MSVLLIHVPERGFSSAEPDATPPICEWSLRQSDADIAPLSGTSPPSQLAKADETIIIVPASRVLFTQVKLPPGSGHRLTQALRFAVEEKLLSDPEAVHAVAGPRQSDGSALVAVIDKDWLQNVLDTLERAGVHATQMFSETSLIPVTAQSWTMAWDGRHGLVRSQSNGGLVADGGDSGAPPLALKLALQEALTLGETPQRLILRCVPEVVPDLDKWARELGLAVEALGPWNWRSGRAEGDNAINLLQGEFSRSRGGKEWLTWMRPALIALSAIAVLQFSATVVDWWMLSREKNRLQAAITTRFNSVFPGARIVDASLQMRRNLADSRRAHGVADASDFLPLLSRSASVASSAPLRVRALQYEQGKLKLDISLPNQAAVDALRPRLRAPGMNASMDAVNPKNGQIETRLTFSGSTP